MKNGKEKVKTKQNTEGVRTPDFLALAAFALRVLLSKELHGFVADIHGAPEPMASLSARLGRRQHMQQQQ